MTTSFDEEIIKILKMGGVGFMPSDTIYGLSGLALNEQVIEKLHKLKSRDENKPFVVLIADTAQLPELGIEENQARLAQKYWPGALTIIFESLSIPKWLERGTGSLAIRLPDDEELRGLIRKTGPIISTSANPQGREPATSPHEAKKYFGERLDFFVDAGNLSNKLASTIVKLREGELQIIREGVVKL